MKDVKMKDVKEALGIGKNMELLKIMMKGLELLSTEAEELNLHDESDLYLAKWSKLYNLLDEDEKFKRDMEIRKRMGGLNYVD